MGPKDEGSESPEFEPSRLLTQREVARMLGITPSAVSRMLKRGDLKAVRLVRRVMVPLDWLLEWVSTPDNEPAIEELGCSAEDARRIADLQRRTAAAIRAGARRLSDIPPPEVPKKGTDDHDR